MLTYSTGNNAGCNVWYCGEHTELGDSKESQQWTYEGVFKRTDIRMRQNDKTHVYHLPNPHISGGEEKDATKC